MIRVLKWCLRETKELQWIHCYYEKGEKFRENIKLRGAYQGAQMSVENQGQMKLNYISFVFLLSTTHVDTILESMR